MLVSRSAENLETAAAALEGLPGDVAWTVAHVARGDQVDAAVSATLERFGSLDALVNNAGTNPYFGPMVEIDDARILKTVEINQSSVVVWTRAAWRAWMQEHGGVILNIASIGGLGVEPGIGWYNVTKAAVLHITRQLSYELAPDVRVNALAPGLVKTKLAAALWEGPGEDRIAAHIPLRRLGLPDDIATAALFLASDAASWVTGQTFVVDGGTTAQPSGGVG